MLKMTHFTGFINKLILKEEIKTVLECNEVLHSEILTRFELQYSLNYPEFPDSWERFNFLHFIDV